MAEYDERGRSRGGSNPLAEFDAFRARRVAEQEANGSYEATVPVYEYEPDYERDYAYGYPGEVEPTRLVAGGSKQPPGGRGRLRSTAVLLAVALFAVGLGAGVYAATRSSNTGAKAASSPTGSSTSPRAAASATAGTNGGGGMGPGAGSIMGASPDMSADTGMGTGSGMDPMGTPAPDMSQTATSGATRSTLAELAVLDVADNSFTALTVQGVAVTIRITGQTQFGTQAQPFAATDLVPGAQVMARVRRASNGEFVATVITGMGTGSSGTGSSSTGSQPSTQTSPTDTGSAGD